MRTEKALSIWLWLLLTSTSELPYCELKGEHGGKAWPKNAVFLKFTQPRGVVCSLDSDRNVAYRYIRSFSSYWLRQSTSVVGMLMFFRLKFSWAKKKRNQPRKWSIDWMIRCCQDSWRPREQLPRGELRPVSPSRGMKPLLLIPVNGVSFQTLFTKWTYWKRDLVSTVVTATFRVVYTGET